MVDEKKIIESLSPIERKVLPVLEDGMELKEISEKSGCDKTTCFRALDFLKKKKLIETKEKVRKIIITGINGIYYLKKGLPERRLLNELVKEKAIAISRIKEIGLNEQEAKIAVGVLKRKALVSISNGKVLLNASSEEASKKMLEEKFLENLPKNAETLEAQERLAFYNLKARKNIIEIKDERDVKIKLTESGKKISKMNLDEGLIEQLTLKIINSGISGKKFRRYDIISDVKKIHGGKRHFVNQATDYAKKIWLEMGFKEMTGNLVQTGFWNFDVLFTAQDHPVREEQDTFYIKNKTGKLPDAKFVSFVKKSHEGGVDGSKGWESQWTEEEAKKILLRTHTTCLSGQTLKKISESEEFPAKYFALGKCFRNETVDWSHGFEFNQTEGIVVDENATFRQLLGYLKEFFRKMGYDKIRIRPGYFPYTEPSLEIDVFHPARKVWVELGGAGMFRPELTIPIFGRHIPVLAWGPGFDRIIMEYFKIDDLREMYKNDVTKLREIKFWRK